MSNNYRYISPPPRTQSPTSSELARKAVYIVRRSSPPPSLNLTPQDSFYAQMSSRKGEGDDSQSHLATSDRLLLKNIVQSAKAQTTTILTTTTTRTTFKTIKTLSPSQRPVQCSPPTLIKALSASPSPTQQQQQLRILARSSEEIAVKEKPNIVFAEEEEEEEKHCKLSPPHRTITFGSPENSALSHRRAQYSPPSEASKYVILLPENEQEESRFTSLNQSPCEEAAKTNATLVRMAHLHLPQSLYGVEAQSRLSHETAHTRQPSFARTSGVYINNNLFASPTSVISSPAQESRNEDKITEPTASLALSSEVYIHSPDAIKIRADATQNNVVEVEKIIPQQQPKISAEVDKEEESTATLFQKNAGKAQQLIEKSIPNTEDLDRCIQKVDVLLESAKKLSSGDLNNTSLATYPEFEANTLTAIQNCVREQEENISSEKSFDSIQANTFAKRDTTSNKESHRRGRSLKLYEEKFDNLEKLVVNMAERVKRLSSEDPIMQLSKARMEVAAPVRSEPLIVATTDSVVENTGNVAALSSRIDHAVESNSNFKFESTSTDNAQSEAKNQVENESNPALFSAPEGEGSANSLLQSEGSILLEGGSEIQGASNSEIETITNESSHIAASHTVDRESNNALLQSESYLIQMRNSNALQQSDSNALQQSDTNALQQSDSTALEYSDSNALQQSNENTLQPGNSNTLQQSNENKLQQNLSNPQLQNISTTQPQNLSNPQSQNISTTQPQNLSNPQSQNLSNPQLQNLTNPESQNDSNAFQKSNFNTLESSHFKALEQNLSNPQLENLFSPQLENLLSLEPQSNSNAQSQSDSNAQSEGNSNAQSQSDSNAQSQSNPNAQSQSDPNAKSQSNSNTLQHNNSNALQPSSSNKLQHNNSNALQPSSSNKLQQNNSNTPQPNNSNTPQPNNSNTPQPNNSNTLQTHSNPNTLQHSADTHTVQNKILNTAQKQVFEAQAEKKNNLNLEHLRVAIPLLEQQEFITEEPTTIREEALEILKAVEEKKKSGEMSQIKLDAQSDALFGKQNPGECSLKESINSDLNSIENINEESDNNDIASPSQFECQEEEINRKLFQVEKQISNEFLELQEEPNNLQQELQIEQQEKVRAEEEIVGHQTEREESNCTPEIINNYHKSKDINCVLSGTAITTSQREEIEARLKQYEERLESISRNNSSLEFEQVFAEANEERKPEIEKEFVEENKPATPLTETQPPVPADPSTLVPIQHTPFKNVKTQRNLGYTNYNFVYICVSATPSLKGLSTRTGQHQISVASENNAAEDDCQHRGFIAKSSASEMKDEGLETSFDCEEEYYLEEQAGIFERSNENATPTPTHSNGSSTAKGIAAGNNSESTMEDRKKKNMLDNLDRMFKLIAQNSDKKISLPRNEFLSAEDEEEIENLIEPSDQSEEQIFDLRRREEEEEEKNFEEVDSLATLEFEKELEVNNLKVEQEYSRLAEPVISEVAENTTSYGQETEVDNNLALSKAFNQTISLTDQIELVPNRESFNQIQSLEVSDHQSNNNNNNSNIEQSKAYRATEDDDENEYLKMVEEEYGLFENEIEKENEEEMVNVEKVVKVNTTRDVYYRPIEQNEESENEEETESELVPVAEMQERQNNSIPNWQARCSGKKGEVKDSGKKLKASKPLSYKPSEEEAVAKGDIYQMIIDGKLGKKINARSGEKVNSNNKFIEKNKANIQHMERSRQHTDAYTDFKRCLNRNISREMSQKKLCLEQRNSDGKNTEKLHPYHPDETVIDKELVYSYALNDLERMGYAISSSALNITEDSFEREKTSHMFEN